MDYELFLLRAAVELFEMDARCNQVGDAEWVWLQQARCALEQSDNDNMPAAQCDEDSTVDAIGVAIRKQAFEFAGTQPRWHTEPTYFNLEIESSPWPYCEDVVKAPDGRILKDRGVNSKRKSTLIVDLDFADLDFDGLENAEQADEPVYKTPDEILFAPVTTSEPTR